MIVNLKGQEPGAAPAVPRTSGPPSSARGAPAPRSPSGADAPASSPDQAVFDANGDGAIENWGFLHGGDSYTTFTPPPTGSDPTRGRRVEAPSAAATRPASPAPGPTGTPAAIRHAHTAYRRDGSAGAPSAQGPPPNAPHAVVKAPTPGSSAPLRSAG